MNDLIWMIWGIGFGTGGMVVYLGCLLFARRMLKEESLMLNHLLERQSIKNNVVHTFIVKKPMERVVHDETNQIH